MAAIEMNKSVYDHPTGTKSALQTAKPSTTYNPWEVTTESPVLSVFCLGLADSENMKEPKPIRFNAGVLLPGIDKDTATSLLKGTKFIGVKVMGAKETMRIMPQANVQSIRKISGFLQGVLDAPAALICVRGYVFDVGKEINIEIMHVVYTVLPHKVKKHNMKANRIDVRTTRFVAGIHATIRTQGPSGPIILPLCLPFMEWKKKGEALDIIKLIQSCTMKVALGAVNGLSVHVTCISELPKDLKGTGMSRNMLLCPVFEYPNVVFDNCVKEWKITGAKLIVQEQPRIYNPVAKPVMSEKDLLWRALQDVPEYSD